MNCSRCNGLIPSLDFDTTGLCCLCKAQQAHPATSPISNPGLTFQMPWQKDERIERRRRLFEEYVLRLVPGREGDEENLEFWNWPEISKHVEIIICQADAFANKGKEVENE